MPFANFLGHPPVKQFSDLTCRCEIQIKDTLKYLMDPCQLDFVHYAYYYTYYSVLSWCKEFSYQTNVLHLGWSVPKTSD